MKFDTMMKAASTLVLGAGLLLRRRRAPWPTARRRLAN